MLYPCHNPHHHRCRRHRPCRRVDRARNHAPSREARVPMLQELLLRSLLRPRSPGATQRPLHM